MQQQANQVYSLQMYLKGIKLVTFDATNTLLKFRVLPWQYYTVVARDHGFTGSGDEVKERLLSSYKVMWNKHHNFGKNNIGWEDWWRQVVKMTFEGLLPACADVNIIASRLIEEFKTRKCWCIADGCDKLLRILRASNISIGVISNFDPRLNDILQNVSIISSFDFILTSYEIGYCKPDERIFHRATEKCGNDIQPFQCLHIGDDEQKDYKGAIAAGWHARLVTKLPVTTAPEHVFHSLGDLCLAIEQKNLKL